MKREMLKVLLDAAQQAPETPQLLKAMRVTRKQLSKEPMVARPEDYDVALANTSRALECIADGLRWAGELRAKGGGKEKLLPVLMEQNRKAIHLLQF
jgi:hypothetical protein